MMRQSKVALVCLMLTGGLVAQPRSGAPLGIIEARLVGIEASKLVLALEGDKLLDCNVDGRTYVDRDRKRMALNDLKLGDLLEVVTERQGLGVGCFARMIHVVGDYRRFQGRGVVGSVKRSTESFAPRGSLQMTGMVRDLQGGMLELRTKQDGTMKFRLRPDTSFVRDGIEVKLEEVERSQPVNVRAGYDHNGELEVYQVAWGAIVQPGRLMPRP